VFLPKPYRLAEVIGLPDRLAKFEVRLDEHHSGKGTGND
jgi:hypothetical protein